MKRGRVYTPASFLSNPEPLNIYLFRTNIRSGPNQARLVPVIQDEVSLLTPPIPL
jgi:hypothetical protein